MARYLVIEFDDDAQADALRAQIDTATKRGKKFRVVGLFARPGRRVCQCVRSKDDYKPGEIIRGAKYGWWICKRCRRPRLGRQDLKNLLNVRELIEQPTFDAMDLLAVQPRIDSYQIHLGNLTLWPEIRRDVPLAGVEDAPDVGAAYENGEQLPYGRKH